MPKIKSIEVYYDDGSMEKFTSDQEIFLPLAEEILMTKELFETADKIKNEYRERVKQICEP